MIQITKTIEWDMGHRVPNHKHKCQNPHGHRYRLELSLTGKLIAQRGAADEGMIYDFGEIKKALVERIHDCLDHGFMACEDDPIFAPLASGRAKDLNIILVPFIPTAENIVQWCYERLQNSFPQGLMITRLRLYETPNSFSEYIPPSACL